MIRCEGLTRRFGDLVAVDALDLDVAAGEVFGFLGPNGAGKTTTVRMLTALIAPSGGRATVADCVLGEDDERLRGRIGILTETPGVYARLSAADNLRFFARLQGVEDVEGQVSRYLDLLGLASRRDDPAGSFSKGMRQKLAIARALLHEPPVLFLDEPTSGLDPASAKVVREFVLQLSRDERRTVFICTHNLDEARRLCDRVALFRHRVLRTGAPSELAQRLSPDGGAAVRLRLGAGEPPLEALRALPHVEAVEVTEDGLRATVGDPERDNPALIQALVEAGVAVRFVEAEETRSLEQVYLELLGDAPGADAAGEEEPA